MPLRIVMGRRGIEIERLGWDGLHYLVHSLPQFLRAKIKMKQDEDEEEEKNLHPSNPSNSIAHRFSNHHPHHRHHIIFFFLLYLKFSDFLFSFNHKNRDIPTPPLLLVDFQPEFWSKKREKK